MEDYYVNGFTPPRGVNNADAVKKIQKILKVKADGVWGPQTQAAWESQNFASDLTIESARKNEGVRANYTVSGYTPPRGVTDEYKVKAVQSNLGITQDGVWGPETQAAWERQYGNLWQRRVGDVPRTVRSEYMPVVSPGFSLERESARQQHNVQQLLKENEAAGQAAQRTETGHPSPSSSGAIGDFFERLADFITGLWYNDENNDDDMVFITPAPSPTPKPTPRPTPSPTPKPTPSPTPTPPRPLFEIPDPPDPGKKKRDGTTPWAGESGVNHWNTLWNKALEELTEYVPRNDAAMTQEQRMNVILNAVKYIGPSYPYGSGDSYQDNDGKTYYPIDCSGLARKMYSEAGIDVFSGAPSAGFARTGKERGWYTPKADMDTSTLYPGDLVIWEENGTVGHVGVYLCTVDGERWIIESTGSQNGPNVSTEWNIYPRVSNPYKYVVAGYIVPEPNN